MADTPAGGTPPVLPTTDILENLNSIKELEKAYSSFAKILEEKGPAAAVAYVKSLNEVNDAIRDSSNFVNRLINDSGAYADSLEKNASQYRQAIAALKQSLNESSVEINRSTSAYAELEKIKQKMIETDAGLQSVFDDSTSKLDEYTKKINENIDVIKNNKDAKDSYIKAFETEIKINDLLRGKNLSDLRRGEREEYEKLTKTRDEYYEKLKIFTKGDAEQTAASVALTENIGKYFAKLNEFSRGTDQEKIVASQSSLLAKIASINTKVKETQEVMPNAVAKSTQTENIEKFNKSLVALADKFTGVTNSSNIFTQALLSLNTSSVSNFFKSLSTSLFDFEKNISRIGNIITKFLIDPTLEFDKTLAGVNKETGGFRDQFEKIAFSSARVFGIQGREQNVRDLIQYGLGINDLAKSYSVLSKQVVNFNDLSDSQRRLLSLNAAKLENLGVSAQNYGNLINYFVGAIGTTSEAAASMLEKLSVDAIKAGKSVGEYVSNFEKMKGELAAFGEQADEVFASLTKLSKASGLTEQEINKIGKGFFNFQETQKQLSNLRAIVPGLAIDARQLSDTANRSTAEAARLYIFSIKNAVEASGRRMDARMIEAIAQGANTTTEAIQKILHTKETVLNTITSADEKDLEKKKQASADAMTKLTKAIDSMKLSLTPFINLLTGGIEKVTKLIDYFGPGGLLVTAITTFASLAGVSMAGFWFSLNKSMDMFFNKFRLNIGQILKDLSLLTLKQEEALLRPGAGGGAGRVGGFFSRNFNKIGTTLAAVTLATMAYNAFKQPSANEQAVAAAKQQEKDNNTSIDISEIEDLANADKGRKKAASYNPSKRIFDPTINSLSSMDNLKDEKTLIYLDRTKGRNQITFLSPEDEQRFTTDSEEKQYGSAIGKQSIMISPPQSTKQTYQTNSQIKEVSSKESNISVTALSEKTITAMAEQLGKSIFNVFNNEMKVHLEATFSGLEIGKQEQKRIVDLAVKDTFSKSTSRVG